MTANELLRVACVVLGACGSSTGSTPDDDQQEHDGGVTHDAAIPTATGLTGSFEGQAFTLSYATVRWPTGDDSRTWVCVTNVPVTFDQCQKSTPDRIQFKGPFLVPDGGAAQWIVAEVGLFRYDENPRSDIATGATITLFENDPGSGALSLALSVDFFSNGQVTGNVVFP